MENQETMMKKRDFVAERVKSRIDGLLEEADNYTRIMNEDYESFLWIMRKICIKYSLNFPNTAS